MSTWVNAAHLNKVLRLLLRRPIGVPAELDEEADHEADEEDETGGGTELGDEFSKAVELELKRCDLGVALQRCACSSVFASVRQDLVRTHHDLAVLGALADADDDVAAAALENLAAGEHEAIGVGALLGLQPLDGLGIGDLADGVGLAGSGRFVAANVVTAKEDAVDGNDFSGFELEDVANDDIVDIEQTLLAVAEGFDVAFLFLGVELLELSLFLEVIDGADEDDDEDGDHDGDALDPVDLG
jgi:uncharacterized protein YidB (DUF937 family)